MAASGDIFSRLNPAKVVAAAVIGPVPVTKATPAKINYLCAITGTNDNVPHAQVPISSINGTLNADGNDSILVVCPDAATYGAAISARTKGGFIITTVETYPDGSQRAVQSSEYAIDSIESDRGARAWSFSIRGTNKKAAPATGTVQNVYGSSFGYVDINGNPVDPNAGNNNYVVQSGGSVTSVTVDARAANPHKYAVKGLQIVSMTIGGKTRVRCDYNADLRPKDILILPDREMTVGVVTYTIGDNARYMTVSEL